MRFTNKKIFIILSAVLACLMVMPLYAENRYIFPDEVINAQAEKNQYHTEYSAQQRSWTYPQYISDFDKKKETRQYAPSNSVRNNIRYPDTSKRYGKNYRSSNLLYPDDLITKKQNHIRAKKDQIIKYREYEPSPSYPAPSEKVKHSERYSEPDYYRENDRKKDRYEKRNYEKQSNTQYIVGYKYIPVPVYSIPGSVPDRLNLPEMIPENGSYNSALFNNRNNDVIPSQYHSPEKYGVFSRDSNPYSLSPNHHNDLLDLDHLFPQLGSINSDL